MSRPAISIAMATYNGERYLPEQLKSLAAQSDLPCELQVGDDGSTDATLEILEEFARRAPFPVTITRNDTRLGCGENFMAAARRCSGDWIAFSDQDDVWFTNKLARCAAVIRSADESLRLIVHNAVVTSSDLTPGGLLDFGPFGSFRRYALTPNFLAHGFRQVFKREPILAVSNGSGRKLGWIPDSDAHDNWVSVIASLTGTVVSLAESLAYYRRHEQSLSRIQPHDVIERSRGSLANNGRVYQAEGRAFAALAEYLRGNATPDIGYAVDVVERHADLLEQRSQIYLSDNRFTRMAALWRLLRSGAYNNLDGWRLSPQSAVKDLLFSLR